MRGQNGQSATQVIKEQAQRKLKQVAGDAMSIWHAEANKRLMEAASGRSGLDATRDQRGQLTGRQKNSLDKIAKEIMAPVWDDSEKAWTFAVTHPAAGIHEWGAEPHEIKAKSGWLAFEWPDAPEEVQEQFEETFPLVFFKSVQHPGVPAIGFLRYGRDQARTRLEDAGYQAEEFVGEITEGGE